jgi:leader peptidase (prepilin peptidase) / N-methyltransferase
MYFLLPTVAVLAIYISFIDLKTHTISDKSNAWILGLVLVGTLFSAYQEQSFKWFLTAWLIGLLVFIAMYLLALVSGGALGGGDIKFAPSLSVGLAYQDPILSFWSLFLAFQIAGFVALLLLLFRKGSLKRRIAFAPYLTLGFCGVWLWKLVLAGENLY